MLTPSLVSVSLTCEIFISKLQKSWSPRSLLRRSRSHFCVLCLLSFTETHSEDLRNNLEDVFPAFSEKF